jgi:hypothetical protein
MQNLDGFVFTQGQLDIFNSTLAHVEARKQTKAQLWALVPSPIHESRCIPDPDIKNQSALGSTKEERRLTYEKIYACITESFFRLVAPVLCFSPRSFNREPVVVSLASELGYEHLILPRLYPRGFKFFALDIDDQDMNFARDLYSASTHQFLKVDCTNQNKLKNFKADLVFIRHQAAHSYGKIFADITSNGINILNPNGRLIVTSYSAGEQAELLTLLTEFYPTLKPFRIEQNQQPVSASTSQTRKDWHFDSHAMFFGKDENGRLITYDNPFRSFDDQV